jgi:enamine deaminase RidA (YjgF/YER057c/UK114 family)
MNKHIGIIHAILISTLFIATVGCNTAAKETPKETVKDSTVKEVPEFYLFRPKVEKMYGYSHAVKIGNHIKISGAVSMDDNGELVAAGNMDQQMKNCYGDLQKILQHYGCSFDDVTVENVFTTNMADFIKFSAFRNSLYKKNFPAGTWLEVKGLALPGQLIEIYMEAYISK